MRHRPEADLDQIWYRASTLVEHGAKPSDACHRAGIGGSGLARLDRWGDCWVELLDGIQGKTALIVDDFPGLAVARLSVAGATVTVADDVAGRAQFRRVMPGAEAEVVPLASLSLPGRSWDLVVFGPFTSGRSTADLQVAARAVSADGRLVIVTDNLLSPLRALDRLMHRPTAATGALSMAQAMRHANRSGFCYHQGFALLRSSLAPVAAFDVNAPAAARAVLEASATFKNRGRLVATRALARLVELGVAHWVVPAWMGILGCTPAQVDHMRVTGRIGILNSEDPSRLVRGEPPAVIDKRYRSREDADAEWVALRELESVGVAVAPRAIERLGTTANRLSWMPGTSLNLSEMCDDALLKWMEKAGELLGMVHQATARPDGSSLVHGDFALTNCLAEGDRLVGIIDWSTATRGLPIRDLDYLVSTASVAQSRPNLAEALDEAARRGYERSSERRKLSR
ncbi:MAG: phosphotransferase [Acidimicrobiales bacterium]